MKSVGPLSAATDAAWLIDEALPMLAGYVRNAAQYTGQFADSLRDKKAEELLSTAVTWSRQQPLLTLAGAAVLGFALARVAKSGIVGAAQAADGQSPSNGQSSDGRSMGQPMSWDRPIGGTNEG